MSRASDRRRAQALIQAALLVAIAYFTWHAWAGATGTRPVSFCEFIENIGRGRVEAAQVSAAARTEPSRAWV